MKNTNNSKEQFIIEDAKLWSVKKITERIVIPSDVEEIGMYAFTSLIDKLGRCRGYLELKEVEISEGVRVVGESAFNSNVNLEVVKFPSSLESICSYAFYYCNVKEYKLPNNLIYIGSGAFLLNKNLRKLEIPSSVKRVGSYIIGGCDNLEELVIHDGLSIISENAFCIESKYIGDKCLYKRLPKKIIIKYSSYEKLDNLIDNLINSGIFDGIVNYKLELIGPVIDRIDSIKLYPKLLGMKAISFNFNYNDSYDIGNNINRRVKKL